MKEPDLGDRVVNSKCPAWGTGVIKASRGDVVDVEFQNVGRKSVKAAVLERAPAESRKAAAGGNTSEQARYESQLRLLVSRFLSIANRQGIEKIESRIYEAFLGTGKGKAEVKRQLRNWVQTTPHGRHDQANADAVALWNFLFPDDAV